jgi:hypothetical protein
VATVPSQKDWSANTVPTAAEFNDEIRDTVNFCTGPERVLVRHEGGNPDLTTNTWTLLSWDTEDADTEAIHSTSSNNSRLVAVTAGKYQVYLTCRWEPHVAHAITGGRAISVEKNGAGTAGAGVAVCSDRRLASEYVGTTLGVAMASCTGFVQLDVGDYVEAFAWHAEDGIFDDNSAVYHQISGHDAETVRFGMVWIAP